MIRIEELNKYYGKVKALRNFSAHFREGRSIAILGPNASGKTTLIKCILGLVRPSSGRIYFNEELIGADRDYLRHIGYMPQIGRYPDHMRVGQVFELLPALRRTIDQPVLDESLIDDFHLREIFDQPMYTLSGGTRQKVSAALAFLFDPPVLILDEPTAGLDPLAAEVLKQKIRAAWQRGKLILITSHLLSDLEDNVSEVLYVQDGDKKIHASVEELKRATGEQQLSKAIAQLMKNNADQWKRYSATSSTI